MKKPEQSIITLLLEKHALGICTPEEMALLEQWYGAFPEQGSIWKSAEEKAAMKDSLKAGIFNSIAAGKVIPITEAPAKRIRFRWWQAAAAVLVITGSYLLYNTYTNNKEPEIIVVSAAEGKGILRHELPDQSVIWLEPGTTVRYRKDFVNNTREIELPDGMAFFSVTKDPKHPFLVKMPRGMQTKVLGTEFTVKAYKQLTNVQVMVRSGVVQVSHGPQILDTVRANQQLTYREFEQAYERTADPFEDWRTGNMSLQDASLIEIILVLKKRYGLQVVYDSQQIRGYRFTIHINKQTTATELLEMLKDISGIQYELNNNTVTFH